MKATFIEYNKDKETMLKDGIVQAVKHIEKDRTIWLVWVSVENIRGHFFQKKDAILSQEDIEDLMAGKQIQVNKSYIKAISVKKISEVKQNDIVIDCFTGELYATQKLNHTSLLIYLPWTLTESDLLQSKFNS